MVSLDHHPRSGTIRLTLAAHRSLSWRDAKMVFLVLSTITLTVAIGFCAMGFPLVLPFAGLELLAVAAAFHVSLSDGRLREVVSISPAEVLVERGRGRPEGQVSLPRPWSRVIREAGPSEWHPRALLIGAAGRRLELGRFLSEGERDIAAVFLRRALGTATGQQLNPAGNTAASAEEE
jgi:uncharacterized membrane protein